MPKKASWFCFVRRIKQLFTMNNTKFTDNELNLMSYQDLRRLSILLRLPANIKKTYMISMIQAHQKGDGFTKTAIANKVMEERKVKKMTTKGRQTKPFLMVSTTTTQQIPTDLSVSTKHEFETRFSYVAHYSSEDSATSGISRIIKEEAEVSRRNRNILHQTRKPSRKIPTMGRTEIMLPRNHSLTTPVRLMPQYEKSYSPLSPFETVPVLTNSKAHYQDGSSYNYHFHGEYSHALMTSSATHELYRNETYWPPRNVYNNSLMPILSSLLTPNSVSINSSAFTAQYASQNSAETPSSFQQGIYEKYLKSGSLIDSQAYQSNSAGSTVIFNGNPYPADENNYTEGEGNFAMARNDVDFEVSSTVNDTNSQQYTKRDEGLIRHNSQTYIINHYSPRNDEEQSRTGNMASDRDIPQYVGDFFTSENNNLTSGIDEIPFKKSNSSYLSHLKVNCSEVNHCHTNSSHVTDENIEFERLYVNDEKNCQESVNDRNDEWRETLIKNNFMAIPISETRGNVLSESSENFNYYVSEGGQESEIWDKISSNGRYPYSPCNLQRCRYVLGHDKYPEIVNRKSKETTSFVLPSFWSTFCTYNAHNKAYSLCKNSFTGTTEAHSNPIMTSTYPTQYASHGSAQLTSNNSEKNFQKSCSWIYSYPESQSSFSIENTTYSAWNENSNERV